ncbi:MAG: hypothetical protein ABW217_03895 [Polyangiaceae bacterium]
MSDTQKPAGKVPRTKADWDPAIAECDTMSLEDARASARLWRTYARDRAPETEEEADRQDAELAAFRAGVAKPQAPQAGASQASGGKGWWIALSIVAVLFVLAMMGQQ